MLRKRKFQLLFEVLDLNLASFSQNGDFIKITEDTLDNGPFSILRHTVDIGLDLL